MPTKCWTDYLAMNEILAAHCRLVGRWATVGERPRCAQGCWVPAADTQKLMCVDDPELSGTVT